MKTNPTVTLWRRWGRKWRENRVKKSFLWVERNVSFGFVVLFTVFCLFTLVDFLGFHFHFEIFFWPREWPRALPPGSFEMHLLLALGDQGKAFFVCFCFLFNVLSVFCYRQIFQGLIPPSPPFQKKKTGNGSTTGLTNASRYRCHHVIPLRISHGS